MSDNKFIDTTYAGKDPHYLKLLEEARGCPFCPPNFPGENIILHSVQGSKGKWYIMERLKKLEAYPHTDKHLLILPEKHISSSDGLSGFTELPVEDILAVQALTKWAEDNKEFSIFKIGGGLAVRLGTNSGVAIRHIHFHLIAPVTNPETGKVFPGEHVDFAIG